MIRTRRMPRPDARRLRVAPDQAARQLARATLAFCLAMACASPAAACTVTSALVTSLGTYSPGAVRAKAVPALSSRAGLQCGTAVLVLLNNNSIKATLHSANGLKLVRAEGGSVAYKASADPNATVLIGQDATIDYMQNNLLNLLGLLGGSNADLPFFVRPDEATLPPVGVYRDRITIAWNWNLCTGGIGLLGICLGISDVGTGTSVIDVTLSVTPQNATVTTSSQTTWDPVAATNSPKALPGSRRAVTTTFANPDIVPLDAGTVDIVLPTPAGTMIALDGDGATAGAAITLADGTPASSMQIQYRGPADGTDDVDFSDDHGRSWSYTPVAGDHASQRAVTDVRVRARGTMAPTSSFSVRVPYLVQ